MASGVAGLECLASYRFDLLLQLHQSGIGHVLPFRIVQLFIVGRVSLRTRMVNEATKRALRRASQ
jgi:hypothetical protein